MAGHPCGCKPAAAAAGMSRPRTRERDRDARRRLKSPPGLPVCRRPAYMQADHVPLLAFCPRRPAATRGSAALMPEPAMPAQRLRTLFISDLHLGAHGCQAAALLGFLRACEVERIYLVGDIVDGWRLRARWYWPSAHDAVLRCLLDKRAAGTEVFYLPGNHDEFLRASIGQRFGGIEVVDRVIHEGADGRRHLVIHGDQFDEVMDRLHRLHRMRGWMYSAVIIANDAGLMAWRGLRRAAGRTRRRRRLGFERRAVAAAARLGADSVICGHVHRPAIREFGGVQYINTGDWIESRSAVVEHRDGRLEMLRWPRAPRRPVLRARAARVWLAAMLARRTV
jgi:UDP-2,3-diacylglucosamine pyrophosphatase LpxH